MLCKSLTHACVICVNLSAGKCYVCCMFTLACMCVFYIQTRKCSRVVHVACMLCTNLCICLSSTACVVCVNLSVLEHVLCGRVQVGGQVTFWVKLALFSGCVQPLATEPAGELLSWALLPTLPTLDTTRGDSSKVETMLVIMVLWPQSCIPVLALPVSIHWPLTWESDWMWMGSWKIRYSTPKV